MTEKEYRSHPAISRSELWRIHESPEKFKWYRENPQESTPALLFGQVVHKLLLEPDDFETEFAVAPKVDRRTANGKKDWAEFCEIAEGKQVVQAEMYQQAVEMVTTAMSNSLIKSLLAGQHETPFFWTDEMTGEDCKCRTDALVEIGNDLLIVDYKTCTDASNDGFLRSATKYGYTLQAAMYSEGVEQNTGRKPLFVFIAQEKNPPYAVNILQADEKFVEYGYDQFREYLGTYHYCKESGNWFGFLGREGILNTLSLPSYMTKEE